MKYWKIEITFPEWCEDTIVYFDAESKAEAEKIAAEITESEAITAASWYAFDTEEEEEQYIESTDYLLFEVPYEEAKDHI